MKTTLVVLFLAGFFNSGALVQSAAPAAHAHWAYEGDHGPSHWAALDPVYAPCAKGKAQSPVDFTKGGSGTGNSWKLNYGTTSLQIAHHEQVKYLNRRKQS